MLVVYHSGIISVTHNLSSCAVVIEVISRTPIRFHVPKVVIKQYSDLFCLGCAGLKTSAYLQ